MRILLFILFCASPVFAADTTVTYTETTAIIRNPERGFMYNAWVYPNGIPQRMTSGDTLEKYKDSTWSLVQPVYYFSQFVSDSISQARLDSISADLDTIRAHGWKVIPRFAYSTTNDDWTALADLSWIRIHLDQLQPIFQDNADIIVAVQTGFIGRWGEWGTNSLWGDSIRRVQDSVLIKLLSVVPTTRMVLARAPRYKITYMTDTTNIDSANAFDASARSRIGFHNDAILHDWSDAGTYLIDYNTETNEWVYNEADTALIKPYVSEETRFVPLCGEFAGENDTFQETILQEFARLHWTGLSATQIPIQWAEWYANGYADTLYRRLGYRFVLDSAYVSSSVTSGGVLHVRLRIRNTGWATVYNYRPVQLILRDNSDESVHTYTLFTDPRRWEPGLVSIVDQELNIGSLSAGSYDVLVNLPDSFATISSNPDFSIQFANVGTWESTTGYNDLGITTSVVSASRKRLLIRCYASTSPPETAAVYVSGIGYLSTIDQVQDTLDDLSRGDSILFKRGFKYEGRLQFYNTADGLFVGAYGTGAKPIISYRDTVAGWSTEGNWLNTSGHLWRFNLSVKGRRLWDGTREFKQVYDTLASVDPDYGNPTVGLTANHQFWSKKDGYIWVYCENDSPWTFYTGVYNGDATTTDDNQGWGYSCIDLRDVNAITLKDLHLQGGELNALTLWAADSCVVDSVDVSYANTAFRFAYGSDRGEVKYCNLNATDTVTHDYEAPASSSDEQAYNTDLIVVYQGSYWLIHDNTMEGGSHDGVCIQGVSGAVATYNEVYDNVIIGGTDYCRGFETLGSAAGYCAYNKFYRNYVRDMTEWTQFMGDHNEFYYNVMDTVRRSWKPNGYQAGGINMSGFQFASHNKIENNTIANCASGGIVVVNNASSDTCYIQNNIIINCGTDEGSKQGMYGASIVIDVDVAFVMYVRNNLCYSTATDSPYIYNQNYYSTPQVTRMTAAQFNVADAGGDVLSDNLDSDPLLQSDYTILSSSPAKDTGLELGYAVDYFGESVPYNTTPDIGACEWQSGMSVWDRFMREKLLSMLLKR